MGVKPGDRVCIPAGSRTQFRLSNFTGTAAKPITFVNCGGKVTITGNEWYGIAVDKSEHFVITGSGDTAHQYGIKIKDSGTMGVQIGDYSTNFEVDHLEITKVGFAGVMAKTDPTCEKSDLRSFVQKNTVLHDLYIHDIGGEGIYLGYSWYPFRQDGNTCGKKFYPHRLEGVQVYDNRIEGADWDGIQVGSATKGVEIHHNTIMNYGRANKQYQANGMQIGAGTVGKVYGNVISHGKGDGAGIIVLGSGDNTFYNNVIAHSGSNGIYVSDKHYDTSLSPYYFVNNTIVSSADGAIRVSFSKSTDNILANNLMVASKNDHVQNANDRLTQKNNLKFGQLDKAEFVDAKSGNYRLLATSPAVDAGESAKTYGVKRGRAGITRPQGDQYDVGAYEHKASTDEPEPEPTAEPDPEPTETPDEPDSGNPVPADTLVLSIGTERQEAFKLYPNPTRGTLFLQAPSSEDAQITITDTQGHTRMTKVVPAVTNGETISIDTQRHRLSAGLYYLRYQGSESYSFRFFIE